jgi:hypothetical protein
MRNRYLTDPSILKTIGDLHRSVAAEQACATGLLDTDRRGSWTHPSLDRLLHADGKVLTPLFRAKPGDTRVDKQTGEIITHRHEPDAALHFEADGEAAWGTKFVMVAARGTNEGTRVILDLERVEKPGAEASVAMDCFRRLAPLVPGAHGVVYDTALRGVHHQELLRFLGLLPINRVAAAARGARTPRRKDGRRVAKSVHVEDKLARGRDGRAFSVSLYAQDGAIGIGRLTERGQMVFEALRRIRTHRTRDKSGAYRWYNDYGLAAASGRRTSRSSSLPFLSSSSPVAGMNQPQADSPFQIGLASCKVLRRTLVHSALGDEHEALRAARSLHHDHPGLSPR